MSADIKLGRHRPVVIHYAAVNTDFGKALIAYTAKGVCGVSFGEDYNSLTEALAQQFRGHELRREDKSASEWISEVIRYIHEPQTELTAPLDIHGTDFQRQVWHELIKIPAGITKTYTDLANSIGRPNSVRAVAGACAANKIAFIIPCHRIFGKSGALTGYRWGLERKEQLIRHENKAA